MAADDSQRPGLERRAFIRAGVAGGVVLTTFPACGGGDGTPGDPTAFGNISSVAVGSLRVASGVVIGRDANGLYAMTATCTHQGCTVRVSGAALSCPCHGSGFSATGSVTNGPAASPLRHYQVDLAADGTITVDPTMTVSADTRTPVP